MFAYIGSPEKVITNWQTVLFSDYYLSNSNLLRFLPNFLPNKKETIKAAPPGWRTGAVRKPYSLRKSPSQPYYPLLKRIPGFTSAKQEVENLRKRGLPVFATVDFSDPEQKIYLTWIIHRPKGVSSRQRSSQRSRPIPQGSLWERDLFERGLLRRISMRQRTPACHPASAGRVGQAEI